MPTSQESSQPSAGVNGGGAKRESRLGGPMTPNSVGGLREGHTMDKSVNGRDGKEGGAGPDTLRQRTPEDTFRDEIARQIFGDIGQIKDDYSCAVEAKILLHGRLYVTDKFVCFYSNFFGFEKKIKIPYNHVLRVSKGNTALLIPNTIIIVTTRKEYSFRSFWDRDECYFQVALAVRACKGLPPLAREVVADSRALTRDGQLEGGNGNGNGPTNAEGGAGARPSKEGGGPSSSSSSSSSPPHAPPTTPTPSASSGEAKDGLPPVPPALPTPTRRLSPQGPRRAHKQEGEEGGSGTSSSTEDEPEETGDEMLDYDDLVEGTQSLISQDMGAAFEKALEDQPLKDKGLELHLKASMQEFFDEFISDKAPMGLDKYHEARGDQEIEMTPWEDVNQGIGATRSLRFITNLEGLPVGPSTAPVLKLQRLRAFGRHGMILETSCSMENVPAGDCFTVEDRWVMRGVGEGDGEGRRISIVTSLEVKFSKGTLFRSMIESRSRSDVIAFHKKWYEMAQVHLTRRRGERVASPPRKPKAPAPPPPPEHLAIRWARRISDPAVALARRFSDPKALAHSANSFIKRIKWGRLLAAVLVCWGVYTLLRLLVLRIVLLYYGHPPSPAPDSLSLLGPTQQMHALTHEVAALRKEITAMHVEYSKVIGTLSDKIVRLTSEVERLRNK